MEKIMILGAGTWGAALANTLANAGNTVTLWSAIESEIDYLKSTHEHAKLPGTKLNESIKFTKEISETAENDYVLIAVPSIYVRATARQVKPYIHGQIIIDVAKGIEDDTLLTMSEVISQELGIEKGPQAETPTHATAQTRAAAPAGIVTLSGPTHAEEVAVNMPTTIVAASENPEAAEKTVKLFEGTCIRVYTNTDIKGVEICGALKNVIALAAGISDGMGYGDNIKAALLTRGIAEIRRLCVKMGCLPQTPSGLAGIGDLIVTATSRHSRNNHCGNLIGRGMSVADAVKETGMVVEGLNTLPAAVKLAEKYDIDMPITKAVNAIVSGADIKEVVDGIFARPKKSELA